MTKDEALDKALEALEAIIHWYAVRDKNDVMMPPLNQNPEIKESMDAITAIKQARALDKMAENARELGLDYEPVQEPAAWLVEFENGEQELHFDKQSVGETQAPLYTTPPAQPAPVQERNFCERCGKRLGSGIHTCTPPAAPVQEPDEWLTGCPECGMDSGCDCDSGTWNPPAAQRQWVGLTDEERDHIWHDVGNSDAHGDVDGWSGRSVMAAIEAKLKELNT